MNKQNSEVVRMKMNLSGMLLAVAACVAAAAIPAHAADVHIGVNLGAPVYAPPPPVYAPPPPVVYQPGPVYARPPVVIGWHGSRYWDGRRYWNRNDYYRYHGHGRGPHHGPPPGHGHGGPHGRH
jgi:hypothetical protein